MLITRVVRCRKASIAGLALILAVGVVFATYIYWGFSNQKVRLEYKITIRNPASGEVEVNMTLRAPGKPYLHLFLRDPKVNGISRIKRIAIKSGHKALPMWQTVSGIGEIRTVWIGFRKEPVEINYVMDAKCTKGEKPVSFLNAEFGYLRVMNTLYTPITFKDLIAMVRRLNNSDPNAGQAVLRFALPRNWALNSPWDNQTGAALAQVDISSLRNVYFGLGDFTIEKEQGGPGRIPFSLAVFKHLEKGNQEALLRNTPLILQEIVKLLKIKPINKAPSRAITVLPHEPIHGGVSGTNSLVVEHSLQVLTHEIFHWWNGETIDTTKDANWIKEGFTKYYEVKVLQKSGLMKEGESARHFDQLRAELGKINSAGRFDLIKSSERLVLGPGDDRDYNIVYYGGAQVAGYLDQELQRQNKSLDDIWKNLYQHGNPISTNEFIAILTGLGGRRLAVQCNNMVRGRRALP